MKSGFKRQNLLIGKSIWTTYILKKHVCTLTLSELVNKVVKHLKIDCS